MNSEASKLPENVDKQDTLPQLEFSPPERSYQSIASFTNKRGQRFIIQVIGSDKAGVEGYTKQLRDLFQVLPEESEQLSTTDIEITTEALAPTAMVLDLSKGVQPADQPQSTDEVTLVREEIRRYESELTKSIEVTITVTNSGVKAELLQITDNTVVDKAELNLEPNEDSKSVTLTGKANVSTKFQLTVRGTGNLNEITIVSQPDLKQIATNPV